MLDVEVAAASAVYLLSLYNYVRVLKSHTVQKRKRRRTLWMSSVHRNRTLNSMENIFNDIVSEESGGFMNFCRMSPTDFEFLLNKIEPMIKKQTRLRVPIPPKIRLAITLRYLASGDSYRSLHYLFKVSAPTISLIVPEVCKAINVVLRDQMKLPESPEEWLVIEEGFRKTFPRCVGALGGRHILVKSQSHSSSEYKGIHSILLTFLIDSDYRFIFADTGEKGKYSGKGLFQKSLLWQKIDSSAISLPPNAPLPGRKNNVPYVFLADGAFTLHKHIMKPFPGKHEFGTLEHLFNFKLSSTHMIIENVIGLFTSVYRIFAKPVEINLENVPLITRTCILLHNFLRKSESSRDIYTPSGTFDSIVDGQYVAGTWRRNHSGLSAIKPITHVDTRTPKDALEIQSEFANYFHN